MTENDDARLDAALDGLARPKPPPDHVERVLSRTSEAANAAGGLGSTYGQRRWLLPAVAASVLTALGVAWQIDRAVRAGVDDILVATADSATAARVVAPDLNLPVLPPEAYWAMDAFAEFESLRPGAALQNTRVERGSRRPAPNWAPQASTLPPIELTDIAPAPVVVAPLAELADIAFAEIPLAPIAMDPIAEQENP